MCGASARSCSEPGQAGLVEAAAAPTAPAALPSAPTCSVVPAERLTPGEPQHFLRNRPLAKPLSCFTLPGRRCDTSSVTGRFETWLLSCV